MGAESLKDLVRPPFANYDVVVYFGGGLFALPLINHYFVEPSSSYRFPRFSFDIGYAFANDAISLLSLLFAVYLLGHIIAYCASLVVEKMIDTFNGKVSSAILLSTHSQRRDHDETVNAWIWSRFKRAFRKGQVTKNFVRLLAHLPVIPLYVVVDLVFGFDYYRSRIPKHIIATANAKLKAGGYGSISLRTQWYKTLEHLVINNNAAATSRMYNYLVISGLFRSLTVLFLACLWAELYYIIHLGLDGHNLLKPLLSDSTRLIDRLFGFSLLYIAYGFSYSSYMKFQRRYAEEAIFAFVLTKDVASSG